MNNGPVQTSSSRNVLIFRTDLLSYSETFIPAQAEVFRVFTPYYAGLKRVKGVQLPENRTLIAPPPSPLAKLPGHQAIFNRIDPAFKEAIDKIQPQLIHAHFEEGGIEALGLTRSLKIPLVVTCHGYDVTVERSAIKNWFQPRRKDLFKTASAFVGISRFICDQMIRTGYPTGKIRLHYIGVDIERFQPDPTVPKEPTILFVGRLVEKKGCSDLLQAMKIVKSKHPEIKLKIIGDGPLRVPLNAYSQEMKLNVEFCGVQPPEVIRKFLLSALMLCLPSVRAENGDSEGLGIVNLEAQASGIPVVGTAHGGIPEAVVHGVTGLLSAEHNPAALAANIIALLDDPTLRAKMGSAARALVLEHFNLHHQSRMLEKIYLELL
jgi:colanic acid/amylovoran biosynthesis glycosyltransferase